MKAEVIDTSAVRTHPLASRHHKVGVADIARGPASGRSFAAFFNSLPRILAGQDVREVVSAVVHAHAMHRGVILALGAHVIKCGLSPIVIELMRQRIVTAVALNGAGCIHDFELAFVGGTSEDVQDGIGDGHFGFAEETAHHINAALNEALRDTGPAFTAGMGELVARRLERIRPRHPEASILLAGLALDVPVTVHVAIGTDIVHMHPSASGAAIGQASLNDFQRYTTALRELNGGGVYFNIGSAVVLPEVFLKGVALLRNLGEQLDGVVTVDMDMQRHYRPQENVVRRPVVGSGKGYSLSGQHELLLPLLAQAIVETIDAGQTRA